MGCALGKELGCTLGCPEGNDVGCVEGMLVGIAVGAGDRMYAPPKPSPATPTSVE